MQKLYFGVWKHLQKDQLVVHHKCYRNTTFAHLHGTFVGSDTLPSWAEAQSSNMSTATLRFLKLASAHKNKKENIKPFKVNQKGNENLLSLPGNGAKIWLSLSLHKKNDSLNFKSGMCKFSILLL